MTHFLRFTQPGVCDTPLEMRIKDETEGAFTLVDAANRQYHITKASIVELSRFPIPSNYSELTR